MNLSERLQIPTPCGYGARYFCSYRGEHFSGKNALIFWVVERYALRFGPVSTVAAYELYERLAKKYSSSSGIGVILRAMDKRLPKEELFTVYAHPHSMRKMGFNIRKARMLVDDATKHSDGTYFLRNSGSGSCRLCGSPYEYGMSNPNLSQVVRVRQMQKGFYAVCRRPMCKALCLTFPTICRSGEIPMAKVLLELTKNGDRSARIREIAEIAGRDIYRTHNRRSKQKRREDSSAISC